MQYAPYPFTVFSLRLTLKPRALTLHAGIADDTRAVAPNTFLDVPYTSPLPILILDRYPSPHTPATQASVKIDFTFSQRPDNSSVVLFSF
jgi:hypothetical protein